MNRLKREIENAAKRAEERVRGQKILPVYDLAGKHIGVVHVQRGREPADQIRAINMVEAEKAGIAGVDDADKKGRPDLMRCFLLSKIHPLCYREVKGGHDRFPTDPIDAEWKSDWSDYEDVHKLSDEILAIFPAGEISPLESVLLAWLHLEFEGAHGPREGFAERFGRMVQKTGIAARFTPRIVAEHVARCGALRKRWLELRVTVPQSAS